MSDSIKPIPDAAGYDEAAHRRQRSTGVVIAIGLLLLIGGFTWILASGRVATSNPFWFVGLLVIFAASLTCVSIAFKWMGLCSENEAFSLPQGSIRTLLAIGIMVLFVVFGLDALNTDGSAVPRSVVSPQTAEVAMVPPGTTVAAEVRRYAEMGVLAVPQAAAAPEPGAAAPPQTLRLLRVEAKKPSEVADMQKQLLTTLITLLTTVIGFYFGSRSAEVARDKGAADVKGGDAGEPGGLKTDLDEIDSGRKDFDRRLEDVQPKLNRVPAPSDIEALKAGFNELVQLQQVLTTQRNAFDAARVKAASEGGPWDAVTRALAALKTRQEAASKRLKDLEAKLQ